MLLNATHPVETWLNLKPLSRESALRLVLVPDSFHLLLILHVGLHVLIGGLHHISAIGLGLFALGRDSERLLGVLRR